MTFWRPTFGKSVIHLGMWGLTVTLSQPSYWNKVSRETVNEGLGAMWPSPNSMDYALQWEWSTWIKSTNVDYLLLFHTKKWQTNLL